MTSDQIVSSWKNEDYRLSLSSDEQALLPENPAGWIELEDEELVGVDGATSQTPLTELVTFISLVTITADSCPIYCLPLP